MDFLCCDGAGKPFTVVGDGTQTRDFLYVTDVAAAFVAAAETEFAGRYWNLGAGKPQSVNRLTELLGGETSHLPNPPDDPACTAAEIPPHTPRRAPPTHGR